MYFHNLPCYILIMGKKIFTVTHEVNPGVFQYTKTGAIYDEVTKFKSSQTVPAQSTTPKKMEEERLIHTRQPTAPVIKGWRRLGLRQTGNVPLRRRSRWFGRRAVCLVFKDQDKFENCGALSQHHLHKVSVVDGVAAAPCYFNNHLLQL